MPSSSVTRVLLAGSAEVMPVPPGTTFSKSSCRQGLQLACPRSACTEARALRRHRSALRHASGLTNPLTSAARALLDQVILTLCFNVECNRGLAGFEGGDTGPKLAL